MISKVKYCVDSQSKDLKRDWMKKFLNLNENDIRLLRKDRKRRGLNKIFEESRENAESTEKGENEILSDDIAAIDGPFCGEL